MLSSFRKSASLASLCLLTAGTSLLLSCSKDTIAPSAAPTASTLTANAKADYSGEELFQAVFLLQGEAVAHIPYFSSAQLALAREYRQHPERKLERAAAATQLTQLVRELAPGYFAELKSAVDAQDFSRIETSLRKGAALYQLAGLSLFGSPQPGGQAATRLDLAKYNFEQQADYERFLADLKALVPSTPSSSVSTDQGLNVVVVYQPVVMDWGTLAMDQVYFYMPPTIWSSQQLRAGQDQMSSTMGKKADLEKEQLVRDLAFLSAGQR